MIKRILRRFPHALRGLYRALRTDFSFQTQWYGGLLTTSIVIWWVWPITTTELLFLALGFALLLITELQNSSVETALDRLHPELHDAIGHSKDVAAAAVLVAGGFFATTLAIIVGSRIFF